MFVRSLRCSLQVQYIARLKARNDLAIPGTPEDYEPKEDEPMTPDSGDASDEYGFFEREERAQHEAAAMKRFPKDGDDCRPVKLQRSRAIPKQSVDELPAFLRVPPGVAQTVCIQIFPSNT